MDPLSQAQESNLHPGQRVMHSQVTDFLSVDRGRYFFGATKLAHDIGQLEIIPIFSGLQSRSALVLIDWRANGFAVRSA